MEYDFVLKFRLPEGSARPRDLVERLGWHARRIAQVPPSLIEWRATPMRTAPSLDRVLVGFVVLAAMVLPQLLGAGGSGDSAKPKVEMRSAPG